MTTARDLINKALQKLGKAFNGTDITAQEADDALYALNALLGSLANDSILIYSRSWETFNINGGDGEYTMGVGGDFNTTKPIFISAAYLKDGVTDYNLSIISDETYNNQITQKGTLGIPAYLNNDNGNPLIKIRLYPIPSQSYQIFLLTEKPATKFTLDDQVILPEGWERMLIYNLAIDIAPEYGLQVDPIVFQIARESKGLVKSSISRNRTMDSNPLVIRSGRFENGWMN